MMGGQFVIERDLQENVAKTLRDALGESGWNQTQLAQAAGITRQRLSQILAGDQNLKLSTISLVAAALGASVSITATVDRVGADHRDGR